MIRSASLAFACLAVPLFAQTPAPLTEKIEVSVVNVDVTVLEHGQPVHGLAADDFEVFEDGKPRKITNFYVVEGGAVTTTNTTVTPAVNEDRFRRRVLVVIDNTLVTKPRRTFVLQKLRQFIDEHFDGDYDWSVISLGPGAKTALPFTSDKRKIHEALLAIQRGGTVPRSDPRDTRIDNYLRSRTADDLERGNAFLDRFYMSEGAFRAAYMTMAIGRIAGALGAAPGKKIVLLVSSGFPGASGRTMTPEGAETAIALQKLHDAVIRDVNSANVSVFILDPEGLSQDLMGKSLPTPGDESGAFWTARETGGEYLRGNRPNQSLQAVDRATANFYSLGYALDRPEDDKYHRITVRVRRPGHYTLNYRLGYSSRSSEQQLERALVSPVGIASLRSAIPVTMTLGHVTERGHKTVVPVTVAVPGDRLQLIPRDDHLVGRIHMYVTIFGRDGALLGFHHFSSDVETPKSEDVTLSMMAPFALPHGSYQLVVTVRDDLTNELGIATSDLSV